MYEDVCSQGGYVIAPGHGNHDVVAHSARAYEIVRPDLEARPQLLRGAAQLRSPSADADAP